MSIFVELTQLQDDIAKREQGVYQILQTAYNLANQLQNARAEFWSLPDVRLLEALNFDVKTSKDSVTEFDKLATAVNHFLDEAVLDRPELAGTFAARAPLGFGRADVIFNAATLEFEIVP